MLSNQTLIVVSGSAITLLLVVLQSSHFLFRHSLLDHKLMNVMILLALSVCILETVTYLCSERVIPAAPRVIVAMSVWQYITNALFSLIWVVYVDYKLFADMRGFKRRRRLLLIPAALVVLCSILNLFTPVFFSVDPVSGAYTRTDLYFLPVLVAGFYLAYGIVLSYRYKNRVGKYLTFPAMVFTVPIILGAGLDTFFSGMGLKQIGMAIALTALYINVQKDMSGIDPLSGLYSRQYLTDYLTAETDSFSSSKPLAGILIDIDQFKLINDTYGHLVGDGAIRSFGRLLYDNVDKQDVAMRYAGDEFLIIARCDDEELLAKRISRLQKAVERFNAEGSQPYTIRFSAGYSIFDRNVDTVDTFFERMDKAMYSIKAAKQTETL
jgi:diguanylate cyclase (GGDEF)-like protein